MSRTQQVIFLKLKHKLDRNCQYCFYLRKKLNWAGMRHSFGRQKKIVRSELWTYFFLELFCVIQKTIRSQEITGKLNLCERCYATQIYVLLTLPIEFLLINLNIVLLFKTSLKWEIRYLYIMKKTLIKRKKNNRESYYFSLYQRINVHFRKRSGSDRISRVHGKTYKISVYANLYDIWRKCFLV